MASKYPYIRWTKYTPTGLSRVVDTPTWSLVRKTLVLRNEKEMVDETSLMSVCRHQSQPYYVFRVHRASDSLSRVSSEKFDSLSSALAGAKAWYAKNKSFWD